MIAHLLSDYMDPASIFAHKKNVLNAAFLGSVIDYIETCRPVIFGLGSASKQQFFLHQNNIIEESNGVEGKFFIDTKLILKK